MQNPVGLNWYLNLDAGFEASEMNLRHRHSCTKLIDLSKLCKSIKCLLCCFKIYSLFTDPAFLQGHFLYFHSCRDIAITLSPCLVVMGWDSQYERSGFESQHSILDGHLFKFICCKNCVDFGFKKTENKRRRTKKEKDRRKRERPKINEKEAGDGPFLEKRPAGSVSIMISKSRDIVSADRPFSHSNVNLRFRFQLEMDF